MNLTERIDAALGQQAALLNQVNALSSELANLKSEALGNVSDGQANEAQVDENTKYGPTVNIPGISRPVGIHEPIYFEPKPSNFTWAEFTKGGSRLPIEQNVSMRLVKLARYMDEVREELGCPLMITSGYRPPAVNKAVGGAADSRHMYGDAVDFSPVGFDLIECFEILKSFHKSGGLAVGNGFIHIDMRPGPAVRWHYRGGPKVELW